MITQSLRVVARSPRVSLAPAWSCQGQGPFRSNRRRSSSRPRCCRDPRVPSPSRSGRSRACLRCPERSAGASAGTDRPATRRPACPRGLPGRPCRSPWACPFGAQRLSLRVGRRLGDRGLRLALGLEDRRLLLSFGGENLRLLEALGGKDRGPLVTVGAHLLFHRVLDGRRRIDRLQLDAIDLDAPLTRWPRRARRAAAS